MRQYMKVCKQNIWGFEYTIFRFRGIKFLHTLLLDIVKKKCVLLFFIFFKATNNTFEVKKINGAF